MKEKLLQFWDAVKEFWEKLSRKAKILLLSAIGAVVILCLVLALILNQKTYALLYNDLTTNEQAKALAILSELGIEPVVEPSGAILIEEKDLNRARMQLATQGFPGSSFGYDVYNPGLTATQYDKNIKNAQQTQDRLQATIETFEEVSRAIVTISVPEKNAFALQDDVVEPSASVMIVKRPGRSLSAEQVRGIVNIVRDGVAGLKESNISITDETGDLKATMLLDGDINNAKLRLGEEVNQTVRGKVLSVVQPMFGPGKVEVAVSSVLDTDSKMSESVTYSRPEDGEAGGLLDYSDHDRLKEGNGAGVAEGVPGANDNVQTPQYGENEGELRDSAYYSTHDTYDYLVDSTKEQVKKEGLEIVDMQVAVVVDAKNLVDGQRDQIIAIAANAAGVPRENITVQNFEFVKDPNADAEKAAAGFDLTKLIVIAGIVLILLIVIITTIIILVGKKKQKEQQKDDVVMEYDENGVPLMDLMDQGDDFEPIALQETQEQKLKAQIKDLADSDPEIVAQLIKTWLVSGT